MSDTRELEAAWLREMAVSIKATATNPSEQELADALAAMRATLDAMNAATYSHVDGRDLLHELQPNGAHHIDIIVRINGQDRRYQGDWLKRLTHARDGHNMGEYADNPKLRAMIETSRAAAPKG